MTLARQSVTSRLGVVQTRTRMAWFTLVSVPGEARGSERQLLLGAIFCAGAASASNRQGSRAGAPVDAHSRFMRGGCHFWRSA
jgi:hypothetical protein